MAKVIIPRGGIAGMRAAHELIERSIEAEIDEKHAAYVGEKTRSVSIPLTTMNGTTVLPDEYRFRFFPGFYRHSINTTSRIRLSGSIAPCCGLWKSDTFRGPGAMQLSDQERFGKGLA